MTQNRWEREEIRCTLLWRLARNHGWANWTAETALIRSVPSHERGRARDILTTIRDEPYIHHASNRGYKIDHSSIDTLADELRNTCGFSEFRIETTLSHFRGFD